jgi:hypothetical protein
MTLLPSLLLPLLATATRSSIIGGPPPDPPVFSFAKAISDGMVLAAAPKQAMVWGFCKPGSRVTVILDDGGAAMAMAATVGPDQATGRTTTWRTLLPVTPASLANHTITATTGGVTLTLSRVLFGEVWVCSGQSNSACDDRYPRPALSFAQLARALMG